MARPSVFAVAGGDPAFLALARAHHERCLADPVLNHPFSHLGHPDHVPRLAAYWGEVFGGPPAYSDTAGDHSFVLSLHAHMGADADLGERFLACFLSAIDDVHLPSDPDLRRVLRAYMRWAVDEVMSYSPMDSVVPEQRRVPRWDWQGLVA